MSKLLLASNGQFLYDEGYRLLGIPLNDIRLAYVTTASKGARNHEYLLRHKENMRTLGLAYEEIDIEDESPKRLALRLSDKNVIHVEGGNTFYLLKVIRECGFEAVVREAIERGLIYVGTSAGSYVACKNIEPSTWNPDQKDHFGVTEYSAMGLVPFAMKVHYTDDMKSWLEKRIHEVDYPVRIVRDGQGIFVEGDSVRLVGVGEEVIV